MLPLLPPAGSFGRPGHDQALVDGTAVDLAPTHGEAEPIVAFCERPAEDRGRHGLGPDRIGPGCVLLVDLRPGRRGTRLRHDPLVEKPAKGILVLSIGGRLTSHGHGERVERPDSRIRHGTTDRPREDARGLASEDGRKTTRLQYAQSLDWLPVVIEHSERDKPTYRLELVRVARPSAAAR